MSNLQELPDFDDLTKPSAEAGVEPGYDAWKVAKIEAALEQSKDRSAMIPLDKVWKRFGFER